MFGLFKSKKEIDLIEKELKNQDCDINKNSPKENKKVRKEFVEAVKRDFDKAKADTFTKDIYKGFVKLTIPLYGIISAIVFLLITIFVNIFLGLFVLVICIIVGLLFYYFVAKICKY